MKFDELFNAPFESINKANRKILTSLVELKYCFKLPAEYYE